jgi:hypothetical protein
MTATLAAAARHRGASGTSRTAGKGECFPSPASSTTRIGTQHETG